MNFSCHNRKITRNKMDKYNQGTYLLRRERRLPVSRVLRAIVFGTGVLCAFFRYEARADVRTPLFLAGSHAINLPPPTNDGSSADMLTYCANVTKTQNDACRPWLLLQHAEIGEVFGNCYGKNVDDCERDTTCSFCSECNAAADITDSENKVDGVCLPNGDAFAWQWEQNQRNYTPGPSFNSFRECRKRHSSDCNGECERCNVSEGGSDENYCLPLKPLGEATSCASLRTWRSLQERFPDVSQVLPLLGSSPFEDNNSINGTSVGQSCSNVLGTTPSANIGCRWFVSLIGSEPEQRRNYLNCYKNSAKLNPALCEQILGPEGCSDLPPERKDICGDQCDHCDTQSCMVLSKEGICTPSGAVFREQMKVEAVQPRRTGSFFNILSCIDRSKGECSLSPASPPSDSISCQWCDYRASTEQEEAQGACLPYGVTESGTAGSNTSLCNIFSYLKSHITTPVSLETAANTGLDNSSLVSLQVEASEEQQDEETVHETHASLGDDEVESGSNTSSGSAENNNPPSSSGTVTSGAYSVFWLRPTLAAILKWIIWSPLPWSN